MAKTLDFSKYHGTGNDFVVIDNRKGEAEILTGELRALICHRRFGIGADGIIYLEENTQGLYMRYFNADGHTGSLCGNGSRCFVLYCTQLGIWCNEGFYAADGHHRARLLPDNRIGIAFTNATLPSRHGTDWFLNTGSPHVVRIMQNLEKLDVVGIGKITRHSSQYAPGGTNVNFLEEKNGRLYLRTFERGVEDETLSCGTGAVASALVWAASNEALGENRLAVETPGGRLEVEFGFDGKGFHNIWLIGPAVHVMDGKWLLPDEQFH